MWEVLGEFYFTLTYGAYFEEQTASCVVLMFQKGYIDILLKHLLNYDMNKA